MFVKEVLNYKYLLQKFIQENTPSIHSRK